MQINTTKTGERKLKLTKRETDTLAAAGAISNDLFVFNVNGVKDEAGKAHSALAELTKALVKIGAIG